ncbi:hypothetical protein FRC19_002081 [Serendipita sp. 401]|nr:hypothetical protein FRC19_002081 [Serendipita sp. 401]
MHPHFIAAFIYFLLLDRSGLVGALPMQGANDPDNNPSGRTSRVLKTPNPYSTPKMAESDAAAAAKASRQPLPPLKEGFPLVTPEVLTKTCDAVHNYGIEAIKDNLREDGKMPDERHLTGDLILRFRKVGKMVVGQHTQAQEGKKSAIDLYIKLTFAEAAPKGGKSKIGAGTIISKMGNLNLGPSKKSKQSSSAAPAAAEPDPATSEDTIRHIIAIQAKSAKPIAQAHEDSDEEPEQEETQPAVPDVQHPEDPKWEIDFTYKGKNAKEPQMYMLRNYLGELHREHDGQVPEVAIIGGYLVYTQDGYIWIPIDKVIAKCEEILGRKCAKGDRKLNRKLTHYFLSQESQWRDGASPPPVVQGSSKRQGKSTALAAPQMRCFLEDMKNTPRFVPN